MKARTFLLTTSVAFALVVPAAHAATAKNTLCQTRLHTVAKSRASMTQSQVHKTFVPAPVASISTPAIPATSTDNNALTSGSQAAQPSDASVKTSLQDTPDPYAFLLEP